MISDIVISAQNLVLGYKSDKAVIENTSFEIKKKDFAFITGRSGSGKSTILKSLYAEIALRDGELSVCGCNLRNINIKDLNLLRRHIGIIFQDYKLIKEWNVKDNVMLPLKIAGYPKSICESQALKLLNHVKLPHKSDKYPLELSGGEQQRISVARALSNNPILILADEPTGNLDDYSSTVIWDLLEKANRHLDATIVVVTHRIPKKFNTRYREFFINKGVLNELA